mgnify:CR=1 FL=1
MTLGEFIKNLGGDDVIQVIVRVDGLAFSAMYNAQYLKERKTEIKEREVVEVMYGMGGEIAVWLWERK